MKKVTREPRGKRRFYVVGAITLLLAIIWMATPSKSARAMARMKDLQKEMGSEAAKSWAPETRQEKMKQMAEWSKQISPEDKNKLAEAGRQKLEKELRDYAKLPARDKIKYLDERIDRGIKARKEFEQRMAQNGNTAKGPGGMGNGTGAAAFGFAGGPNGKGPGGTPRSAEDKENRKKQRLDNSTPEFRQLMDQFHKDMAARRQQRGLPAQPSRPF